MLYSISSRENEETIYVFLFDKVDNDKTFLFKENAMEECFLSLPIAAMQLTLVT